MRLSEEGASLMIINSLKNVICLGRGRSWLAGRGERGQNLTSGPGDTFSVCPFSLCLLMGVYWVPVTMQSVGAGEKMSQRSGSTFQGGRQHVNAELQCWHTLLCCTGSPLAVPCERQDQLFVVNPMLSHGFLNKLIFCATVWRVQALESGRSGFKSWLFYLTAVWPWAIDFVRLGHIFVLGDMSGLNVMRIELYKVHPSVLTGRGLAEGEGWPKGWCRTRKESPSSSFAVAVLGSTGLCTYRSYLFMFVHEWNTFFSKVWVKELLQRSFNPEGERNRETDR